jgi:hypothetical protein
MAEEANQAAEVTEDALDTVAGQAIEPAAEQVQTADQRAEAIVADKMKEIFARNDTKNQADELEEADFEGPDNPDGDVPAKEKPDAGKPEEEPGEEAATGEEDPEPGEEAGGELTAEEKAEQAKQKKVIDAFDPNLRKIAKELGGWKETDIDALIVANPTLARVTFSNMAASYNALSLQYARGTRPVNPAQTPAQQTAATQPSANPLDDLLNNPAKLAQLQEVAGEELTKLFIKPLLDERRAILEDRQFLSEMRRDALIREVNTSFSEVANGGFEEFYGRDGEVTQQQQDNRFKVGQLADQIRAGAQLQGVNMDVREAVKRAHLIVTADQVQAKARREVRAQVQQRSTQITARPTQRKPRQTAKRGDDAALAAVEQFWDERA